MNSDLEAQLRLVKDFFEEMFGCVVGCGCWEPGWDNEDAIAKFARDGFAPGWKESHTPAAVLEALSGCFVTLQESDMLDVQRVLELHFVNAQDFRDFFSAARERLARALESQLE